MLITDEVNHLNSMPDDYNLVIIWTVEDVQVAAKDGGVNLTKKQCVAILKLLEDQYDCNHGIDWETVGDATARHLSSINPRRGVCSINEETGIATCYDGRTGLTHSIHPNISATGSVAGMINLGYWDAQHNIVRQDGLIYNTSITSWDTRNIMDLWCYNHCQCSDCQGNAA